MTQRQQLKSILEYYGGFNQCIKTMEEMGELQQSLAKFLCHEHYTTEQLGPILANIKEELADLSIMVEQLQMNFTTERYFQALRQEKIDRTLERIHQDTKV